MRVLLTGAGGELGTRVAMLLEAESAVEEIVGIDGDPPRRRLRRTDFQRVDPRHRDRTVDLVRSFRPTAVVHLGIYEPHARSTPHAAHHRTTAGTLSVLRAASGGELEAMVVRSGIEVYGRRRGSPLVPDESVPAMPTTSFGRTLLEVERVAGAAAISGNTSVALLRMAPVVGPHFPSPLGRYLRLPAVGFSASADPPFALLHQEDAARAVVHALLHRAHGTWNVVGGGASTVSQAARIGGRLPVPVAGPGWLAARAAASMAGAPLPDHVVELLRRGRVASGRRIADEIGFEPLLGTPGVVRELHAWAPVTHLDSVRGAAA